MHNNFYGLNSYVDVTVVVFIVNKKPHDIIWANGKYSLEDIQKNVEQLSTRLEKPVCCSLDKYTVEKGMVTYWNEQIDTVVVRRFYYLVKVTIPTE